MTRKVDVLTWLDHRSRFLTRHPAGVRLRHTLSSLAGRAGSFEVATGDLVLEGGIGDREYLRSLASGGWEQLNVSLFREAIRPGMVVADVGAHIGYFALTAAKIVGPYGRVWAFEPNPDSLRYLRRSAERNGLVERVTALPIAVSDATGTAEFHLAPGNRMSSGLFVKHDFERTVRVETGCLDDLVRGAVDVMKMDVEGAEVRALRGMPRILRQLSTLCIECNPPFLRSSGSSADELLELLDDAGLKVQAIDERKRRLRPVEAADLSGGYLNLYAAR
jgi:FkbM family methyltransferase